MSTEKIYITATELAEFLGVSKGMAYKLIREMNDELKKAGYLTISGRCPRRYVEEKWFGFGT